MNHVSLIGRLTQDPQLGYAADGTPFTTFGMAVNQPADEREQADFFDVTAFGAVGDAVATYMTKGRLIGVEGRLRQQRWVGGQRVDVVARSIDFLDRPPRENTQPVHDDDSDEQAPQDAQIVDLVTSRDLSEEPF